MSLEALNNKVLVLNKGWQVINTTTAKDAICKVYNGAAKIIGLDFAMYDFDNWLLSWEDAARLDEINEKRIVSSMNFHFVTPEIIVLSNYKNYKHREGKFSRRNVFIRDNYTCQYCRQKKDTKSLNIDHVMPKSRGGKTIWTNVVLSCIKCNTKKADKTPQEAGMPLMNKPVKPHWSILAKNFKSEIFPESWKNFIDAAYWNAELKN